MTRAKAILVACLLLLGSTAWGQGVIPPGSRVGVIDMMSIDVTHFHVGRVQVNSFMRTYRAAWSTSDLIDDPLIMSLSSAGLEPVSLEASDLLRRQRQAWIVSNPQASKLPKACIEEIEKIMTANTLSALVVIAAGPNSSPESVEGNRLKKLPNYVQGWGFSTSDDPEGTTKPVVFNLTQMLLLLKTTDGVRLEYREWGGGYVYEWANFSAGPDLKSLPDSEIAKFKPVIADVMKRQIGRLMPHIKP